MLALSELSSEPFDLRPSRPYLRVPGRSILDLAQYEMVWRDSGTHSADETGTPSRCGCISHRQPAGHSRSFLQDYTLVRLDMGITGFAPGDSQVRRPVLPLHAHMMRIAVEIGSAGLTLTGGTHRRNKETRDESG